MCAAHDAHMEEQVLSVLTPVPLLVRPFIPLLEARSLALVVLLHAGLLEKRDIDLIGFEEVSYISAELISRPRTTLSTYIVTANTLRQGLYEMCIVLKVHWSAKEMVEQVLFPCFLSIIHSADDDVNSLTSICIGIINEVEVVYKGCLMLT